MNGTDLERERARVGVSRQDLARLLGVSRDRVEAWEGRGQPVPRRYRRQIAWRLAVAERLHALEVSGLPDCAWAAEREQVISPRACGAHQELVELFEHQRTCELCRARDQFELERFGPLPPYLPPVWVRASDAMAERFSLRSPLNVSEAVILLGGIVSVLAAAWLLRHAPYFEPLAILLYPIGLVLGAVVVLALYFALTPLHSLGALGRWLSRCVAAAGGTMAFLGLFVIAGYGALLGRGDPATWRDTIVTCAVLGVGWGSLWPLARGSRVGSYFPR